MTVPKPKKEETDNVYPEVKGIAQEQMLRATISVPIMVPIGTTDMYFVGG